MSKLAYIQSLNKILTTFMVLLLISSCGGSSGGGDQPTPAVSNNMPSINITSPVEGGNQSDEEMTTFTAVASDVEDGDISSNINWSSNIDGNLGIGAQLSLFLSPGDHFITAEILDSDNNSSQDVVNYKIKASYADVSLSWTAPTENTDDSELTDLAGFKIYYGDSEDQLTNSITIYSITTLDMVIDDLRTEQYYYFAIIAFNVYEIESEFSDIVSIFLEG